MTLAPGTRLGAYEVVGLLGVGGMGEVYRARDTTLNREVALKVLPDSLAGDPDRLARFRREAQVLASLNHPNIAHIHGFEQAVAGQSATFAIVMELVEGPTLADRIAEGPIPPADAWPIARQIVDALEAAHDQGIVHRDLKPANIKVRDDGTVKVLDFGLAKALDPTDPSSPASVSNSPTLTARATQLGMILGTAAYMAPEQARGRAVDRRADIWAFGVVCYEMLSGRRAFDGDDISITLAGVLKEEVKWDALPADLPASIRRLLRRCLEKDPKRRLGAISDARLELDEVTSPAESVAAGGPPSAMSQRERWIWVSVVTAALALSAFLLWRSASAPEVVLPVARFGVLPPGVGAFTGIPPRFAISPDGLVLAFTATSEVGGTEQLWLRRLDSMEVTPVPGTEGTTGGYTPQFPFWSPDGRYLAFFVQSERVGGEGESRLRIADLQGGSVQNVGELPSNNASGSWNADGVLLVSSQETNGLQRIAASGGVPVQVTNVDPSRNEIAHRFPQFLPDGRHFIYQVQTTERSEWAIFVGSIDSTVSRKLVQTSYARVAAPNLLVYAREDTLFAQTMDPDTWELTGEPAAIVTGLQSWAPNGRAGYSLSNTGVLVHSVNPESQSRSGMPNRQLTWVDRTGRSVGVVEIETSSSRLRLSPDATRVAGLDFVTGRPGVASGALWVANLSRNTKAPLSSGNTVAHSPTWSFDGARLLFGVISAAEPMSVEERMASGATPASRLHQEASHSIAPLDESSDGKLVVFAKALAGRRSLHVLSRVDGTSTPYLENEFDLPQASLSPDRRWLAYTSNESGAYEVVVQPFPDSSKGKWPISTNGGAHPRWRSDGRELFYVDATGRLMAVPITANADLMPGTPVPLFEVPGASVLGGAYAYDVEPGGQRFLVSAQRNRESAIVSLTVTTNWTSDDRKH